MLKQRSKIRMLIGRAYYTLKRFFYWHFSGTSFAHIQNTQPLPHEVFSHQTMLLRKLKAVDMHLQHNKVKNLEIAIKYLDRLIINPGETFSYWRQLGNPTRRKGYVEGMILHNGEVATGIGGGICQLSNLIYWMTLHTPLTVVERWHHSYDVFPDVDRKQPFGSGATCAYPNIDLQIKNNTTQKFQLHLELTDEFLVGSWLSDQEVQERYEIFEKDHYIQSEWWGGYTRNNVISRRVFSKQTGQPIREEEVAKNHAFMMYEPLLTGEVEWGSES